MTLEERRSWLFLIVALVGYGVYVATVLTGAASAPLADLDYVPAMLISIAAAIVVAIVGNIALGALTPRGEQARDVRDCDIARLGDRVGQAFVVIGALAALLLAIVEAQHFFIANAVYLCFVLSAVLGSVTRVVVYRRGF